MASDLFTIGYERATLPDLIARLLSAAVDIVVAFRAVAASRRPGFSKTMPAASLGIGYMHFRALGTPKVGRHAARAGRIAEMWRIYAAHLGEPETHMELGAACQIAANHAAALLCFEAHAHRCQRAMVASLIQERTGCRVVDL